MSEAKVPKWAQAIGSRLAEKFDVSHEPLPLEMDLMLRLFSNEQVEAGRVRKDSDVLAGTKAPRIDARESKSK